MDQCDLWLIGPSGKCFLLPKPVLAFGYCHCLRLCVCLNHPWTCPRHNSSPVQARINKFGQRMQNRLFNVSTVFWGDWLWPSRSNLTWKYRFTPFAFVHVITHHPFKPETPNVDKRCKPGWLWSLLFWGRLTLTFKLKFNLLILRPTVYNTGPMLHSRSSPNLWPELEHRCSMFLLFHEPITSNIRIAVNSWIFRLIIDIAIDWISPEGRYFQWITAVLLCVYIPIVSGIHTHAWHATLSRPEISKHRSSTEIIGHNMGL